MSAGPRRLGTLGAALAILAAGVGAVSASADSGKRVGTGPAGSFWQVTAHSLRKGDMIYAVTAQKGIKTDDGWLTCLGSRSKDYVITGYSGER